MIEQIIGLGFWAAMLLIALGVIAFVWWKDR